MVDRGAVGILVRGSLMGRFSLCKAPFTVLLEHTNLTIPTGVGDRRNATGHSVSINNTKVLTREPQWTKRKLKEANILVKLSQNLYFSFKNATCQQVCTQVA